MQRQSARPGQILALALRHGSLQEAGAEGSFERGSGVGQSPGLVSVAALEVAAVQRAEELGSCFVRADAHEQLGDIAQRGHQVGQVSAPLPVRDEAGKRAKRPVRFG